MQTGGLSQNGPSVAAAREAINIAILEAFMICNRSESARVVMIIDMMKPITRPDGCSKAG